MLETRAGIGPTGGVTTPNEPQDARPPAGTDEPTLVDGPPSRPDPSGTPAEGPEPAVPADAVDPDEERFDRRAAVAIVGALLVAAVIALVWWLLADDEDEVPAGSTTTTTEATSTTATPTTEPPATSSSTAPPTTFSGTLTDEELAVVVWPDQSSSRRFDDPTAAARAFATELLGFTDPLVDEFAAGDARSGEVQLRPAPDGPVTTVLLRQFGDEGSWWVLGAQTPDIEVTEPSAGSAIDSPLQPAGRSRAFEGTVEVEVLVDGSTEPVGSGFVTGGATEQLEPFSGSIEFDADGARWGAVVFRTTGGEDGRVWQATVVRVGFIGAD